jgi:inosine/xanthosine triphosphate pyrophosphatase family protein
MKDLHLMAQGFKRDTGHTGTSSGQISPPVSSKRDKIFRVDEKDSFHAELKKKRQNLMSKKSSKSIDGFKL